jgi:hypothetical protein
MDEKMERWTVTAFDDAAARITLPPRERWLPTDRHPRSSWLAMAMTAAVVALVIGTALWLGADGRIVPAAPSAKPTPSNLIRLAPGGTEAQTWGKVWTGSLGAAVLRPTWLPISSSDVREDVTVRAGRLYRYVVGYYSQTIFPPDPRSLQLLFIGEGPDVLKGRPGAGESFVSVTVRGQAGELVTANDGGFRVVWMEGDIRYTIQAVSGIPASDVLRVAEGLLRVVDPDGRVVTP